MEFLKGVLSDATYNKLTEELNGKDIKLADLSKGQYVDKAKYDTAIADLDTVKGQLAQRDADLTELQKTANLTEEQKKAFADKEAQYKKEKDDLEAKLKANERNAAYKVAIAKTGVIDPVALEAHTREFADKAELKDGELVGLTDYIKGRLGSDLSYLIPKDGKSLGKEFNPNPPAPEETKDDQILKNIGLRKE